MTPQRDQVGHAGLVKAIAVVRVTSPVSLAARQLHPSFGWPPVNAAVERSALRTRPAVPPVAQLLALCSERGRQDTWGNQAWYAHITFPDISHMRSCLRR